MRPENLLVYASTPTTLGSWLCDWGELVCKELGVDGGSLTDPGYFDPNSPWESTPATNVLTLGSVLYTIIVGYWLHRDSGSSKLVVDMRINMHKVDSLLGEENFQRISSFCGCKSQDSELSALYRTIKYYRE